MTFLFEWLESSKWWFKLVDHTIKTTQPLFFGWNDPTKNAETTQPTFFLQYGYTVHHEYVKKKKQRWPNCLLGSLSTKGLQFILSVAYFSIVTQVKPNIERELILSRKVGCLIQKWSRRGWVNRFLPLTIKFHRWSINKYAQVSFLDCALSLPSWFVC